MISALVYSHQLLALLTLAVFLLQGVLGLAAPGYVRHPALRIGSHAIYTLLLITAIALLVAYGWNPLDFGWILIKIALLVVFILLGIIAFKQRFSRPARVVAWLGALAALLWAYASGLTHSAVPFL